MGLKIYLKPKEKIIIAGALINNGNQPAEIYLENEVPVLRQKDLLSEKLADTPCKRIYFVIQLMYFDTANLTAHHQTYWELVRQLVAAAPSTLVMVDSISEEILNNRYYKALKLSKKLIEYEHELISR
ncbi:MAG: flagellar biosynthesis repressor FlbT [Verrucomicrobiota bacterium]|nr:flagellar biosynthesis repressor FlbT [Verrucomicrobiota bacterium]